MLNVNLKVIKRALYCVVWRLHDSLYVDVQLAKPVYWSRIEFVVPTRSSRNLTEGSFATIGVIVDYRYIPSVIKDKWNHHPPNNKVYGYFWLGESRSPFRAGVRRSSGSQDATLLPFRGHRQHSQPDGVCWTTYVFILYSSKWFASVKNSVKICVKF